MTITLMPLPYDDEALSPHISSETLRIHHGAHFKGYVDKVNAAIAGGPLADAPLEDIVRKAAKDDRKLFNSAGQAWNHGFYWHSLSPDGSAPNGDLASAIDGAFGSLDACKQALTKEAVDHFGSGWAWLVSEGGSLKVVSTHDGDTPITGSGVPLLTIDVWEHAYYVDVRNRRPEYVSAVVDNLLNWNFAAENLTRGAPWTYPR